MRKMFVAAPAILILIFLGVLLFFSIHLLRPPRVEPAEAPFDRFSAVRAYAHLKVIAAKPRPLGSPHHFYSCQYIHQQLIQLGLETQVQESHSSRFWGLANVVARLPGRRLGSAILLMAHYDTVPASPGAADDGVGVAALLEAARALAAGPLLERPVVLLFSDGEELGMQGADLFLRSHPWAREVSLVFDLDCMGSGPVLMFETSGGNRRLIREFSRAAVHPFASSLMVTIYKTMPNDTDLSVFLRAGIPGINFTAIGGNQFYHTSGDDLTRVDLSTLQHMGSTVLSLTRYFSHISSNQRSRHNSVHFNILGPLFVHYSESLNIWLLGILFLLLFSAVAIGLNRGYLTSLGMLRSFGAGWVCIMLTISLPVVAWLAIDSIHGKLHNPGNVQKNAYYYIFFMVLAIAVMSACLARLRGRLMPIDLQVGAVASWSLLGVLAVLVLPGASYLFIWPSLSGGLGLLVSHSRGKRRHNWADWTLQVLLGAVPALLLFAPLLYLLFFNQGLNLYSVAGLGLALGLIVWLAVPVLKVVSAIGKCVLASAIGLILLGILAGGAIHSRNLHLFPERCNMHYIVDQNRQKAFWMISGSQRHPWARHFLSMAHPGSPYDRSRNFGLLGGYQQVTYRVEPSPAIAVLEERRYEDRWLLRLRIKPSPDTYMLEIDIPRARIVTTAIDQETVMKSTPAIHRRFYRILFCPPNDGFELLLEMRASPSLDITLISHRLRLPAEAAPGELSRPPGLLPFGMGDAITSIKTFTY